MADDGNGWTVMLDYRTLKTPSKRPMKLPTLSLAKAIAAEWQYQVLTLVYLFSQFFFPPL
jgi:ATP synthase mitochondrial F1 complex assembly factor 2